MAIDVITVCKDKEEATQACIRFLSYYPYRYAAVIELPEGEYGYTTGKTMARLNNLARQGYSVLVVKNHGHTSSGYKSNCVLIG